MHLNVPSPQHSRFEFGYWPENAVTDVWSFVASPIVCTPQKCKMHENRYFSRAELVGMLMEASLAGEGFSTPEDLKAASRVEMQHAFGQGIINREPVLDNAHLTLKALLLYTRSPGSERWIENSEFWGNVVDIAVRSDAGLRVLDVFEDKADAQRAYEWMRGVRVDTTPPMARHIFVAPMFANEDELGVDSDERNESADADGLEPNSDGDAEGVESDEGNESADGDVKTRAALLVETLTSLVSRERVIAAVVNFFRPIRGRMRTVGSDPAADATPLTDFEYDPALVLRAAHVIGNRGTGNEYRQEVKDTQVAETPGDGRRGSGESDSGESGSGESESGDDGKLAVSVFV